MVPENIQRKVTKEAAARMASKTIREQLEANLAEANAHVASISNWRKDLKKEVQNGRLEKRTA